MRCANYADFIVFLITFINTKNLLSLCRFINFAFRNNNQKVARTFIIYNVI